jgi:hypothetical protein
MGAPGSMMSTQVKVVGETEAHPRITLTGSILYAATSLFAEKVERWRA